MTPFPISKTKQDLHLVRKGWHALWGIIYAFSYQYYFSKKTFLIFLAINLILYLFVEVIRKWHPDFHKKSIQHWRWFLRESEMTGVNTGTYFTLSSMIVILFYPKSIAILSILYLGLADPAASLTGILWGKNSIRLLRGKSLIGALTAFAVCFLITSLFLKNSLSFSSLLFISLIGGLAGSITELLSSKIDDNLTIPIISGAVLWAVFYLLNIPT